MGDKRWKLWERSERPETLVNGAKCHVGRCRSAVGGVGQEIGRLKGKSRDEGRASRAFIDHKRHMRHREDGGC